MKLKLKLKRYLFKKMKAFKKFKKSKKIGIYFSIISILNFQICALVSFSASLSFSQILSDMKFPAGFVNLNLDVFEPENLLLQIPYKIDNGGMFSLTDIETSIMISVNYLNVSNSANVTSVFFSRSIRLPDVKPLSVYLGFFEGGRPYFNEIALIDMYNYSGAFEPKFFRMNLSFSAMYYFGLIEFSYCLSQVRI